MKFPEQYQQILRYGIIGATCAGIDFACYSALVLVGINMFIANVIGVNTGILMSFYLNRKYNFKVTDKTLRRFLIFYAVGLTGLGASSLILYVTVDLWHFNEFYSKLVSIVVVALIQFCLNKSVTFRETTTDPEINNTQGIQTQ